MPCHGSYTVAAPFTLFRLCLVAVLASAVRCHALLLRTCHRNYGMPSSRGFSSCHTAMCITTSSTQFFWPCLGTTTLLSCSQFCRSRSWSRCCQRPILPPTHAAAMWGTSSSAVMRYGCRRARYTNSFHPHFLKSHDTWQRFLPVLCERTRTDLVHGLGIKVPSPPGVNVLSPPDVTIWMPSAARRHLPVPQRRARHQYRFRVRDRPRF